MLRDILKPYTPVQWVRATPSLDLEEPTEFEKQLDREQLGDPEQEAIVWPDTNTWLENGRYSFENAPTFILEASATKSDRSKKLIDDWVWLQGGRFSFSDAPTFVIIDNEFSERVQESINAFQIELGISL